MKCIAFPVLLILLATMSCSSLQNGKFMPEENMVLLTLTATTNSVEVGQKAYYSAKEHGSVGTRSKVWSLDENSIELVETHFSYNNIAYNNPKAEIPAGGDAAVKTYIFEGKTPGEARIRVQTIFRGDVTMDKEMTVRVVSAAKD